MPNKECHIGSFMTVQSADTYTISVTEKLTIEESKCWKQVVNDAISSPCKMIEICMNSCKKIDSIGIGLLLIIRNETMKANKFLHINISTKSNCANIIEAAGLHRIFDIDYEAK